MYNTKKEVDAHVRNSLSKLRSDTERNLRGFTIAKLYYRIQEYPSVEQHLIAYLRVKEDNDQAHKLLGQCYQRWQKPDKALQSYQRSLQLNTKQPDILVEVCKLLLAHGDDLNANKAKYWCELAESERVQDEAVFSLRLKLMNKFNGDSDQVEEMIRKEIAARPHDIQLRVRLLRHHIDQQKVLDAFKYVQDIERSQGEPFASSSEWYNAVWLVLTKYEQLPNVKKDWEFWLLLVGCLERQVHLSFSMSSGTLSGGVTETANLLFQLDQYLYKISQFAGRLTAQKELIALFLEHYGGQLLLHVAALIFKREMVQNKNKWKESVKLALPLMLLAYRIQTIDSKEPWMKHCDEQGVKLIQLWNREGAFRCAQVGRTLMSCIEDETVDKENVGVQLNRMVGSQGTLWSSADSVISQIRQTCSDKQWRRSLFGVLFCNSDQKVNEQTSMLVKCPKFGEPVFEMPTYADVERYEESAQYLKPQSLQHMVYLCLGNENLAHVRAKYFSGLNFSTPNIAFCGAESLNQLDMDTFLYAASIQAKRTLDVEREAYENYNSGNRNVSGKPRQLLFVNVQMHLCAEEQASWWDAAYRVYKNMGNDNLSELRSTLQFGIEAVRGINGPKVDMAIVFRLGRLFVTRAQDIVKPLEKSHLEARAESLYKYGLNMLKMHNKGVLEPFRKYFKYVKSNTGAVDREITAAAEDAVSYLAARYFKKSQYEELIDELAGIQLPFATYMQAEAYRKLDEARRTPMKSKRMYLDKASECLNQTLSLLKSTQVDPNHPLNSVIHSEIKRIHQASTKYLNESNSSPAAHNNSSTYEDAEEDTFFLNSSPAFLPSSVGHLNRSRRESINAMTAANAAAAAAAAAKSNSDLEALVKQMANTLCIVKEELVDAIKPQVVSMKNEITALKDKIQQMDEAMKRARIGTTTPSREEVLDDLYLIEDALSNQMYGGNQAGAVGGQTVGGQSHLPPANLFSSTMNGNMFPAQQQQQQQRINTPNALQMQQNAAAAAAAAYNSPIFNPNYPLSYYAPSPLMMAQQAAAAAGVGGPSMMGGRNPMNMPFMDAGGLNYNMPPGPSLLPPPAGAMPNQTDGRGGATNLYGLLSQPPQSQPQPTTPFTPQLPQLNIPPMVPLAQPSAAPTATTAPAQFNKTLNNQPVEKGPPANVVITASDPLPNPNSTPLSSHQPPLSVTIPSHHLKPSLVQTPENLLPPSVAGAPTAFGGMGTTSMFGGFGSTASSSSPFVGFGGAGVGVSSSVVTSTVSSASSVFGTKSSTSVFSSAPIVTSSISSSTFTFKPQVLQAQQAKIEELANEPATLDRTGDSLGSDFNKSGDAEPEYDPRPDFKPIIPLPDEIEVKTGEENEDVMFSYRCKLFRLVDKDWKERGIGDIKILKSKSDGTSRVVMRRDQTHKICANHKITPMTVLTEKSAVGCIWVADDYADEHLRKETFFVRFKLPETMHEFRDAFLKAHKEAEQMAEATSENAETKQTDKSEGQSVVKPATTTTTVAPPFGLAKSSITSFATSTPSQKAETKPAVPAAFTNGPKATTTADSTGLSTTTALGKSLFGGSNLAPAKSEADSTPAESSPFSKFTFGSAAPGVSPFSNLLGSLGKPGSTVASPFGTPFSTAPLATSGVAELNKSTASDADEEYVPTAQFNPVIPLPDLVEVNTGEENEIALFEYRAKLFRFDKQLGEWKERGLGNIKILQHKDNVNSVRLLMRRDQVLKLCCNQRLYKGTSFVYVKNSKTALCWGGKDYSENELVTEMFMIRFKTPEICSDFLAAVHKAQANMTSDGEEGADDTKAVVPPKADAKKDTMAEKAQGFGDAFKPKVGSWNCEACYISNVADTLYCVACDTPKDATVPKKEATTTSVLSTKSKFSFGFAPAATATPVVAQATSQAPAAFSFGAPTITKADSTVSSASTAQKTSSSSADSSTASKGFGDQFKPKVGSWTCEGCYLTNTGDVLRCTACETPKGGTVPKKEADANKGFAPPSQKPDTTAVPTKGFGDQFKPKVGSWTCESCYLTNTGDTLYCTACEAPKDATVVKKDSTASTGLNLSTTGPKFQFGFAQAAAPLNGSGDGAGGDASNAAGQFKFGIPQSTKSEPPKPVFGSLATVGGTDAAKSFTFAAPTATSTQLDLASTAPTTMPSLSKPTFAFSMQSKAMEVPAANTFSLDKKDFSFTLKPKSPGKVGKSPLKMMGGGDADDADDGEYVVEEEENNTYFTPAIPLPDKIDVKTGEENEDVLYVHRAKLYRFVDGEWKERGLGDLKILHHKDTKALRVLMRRDQILKTCLNHALTDEIKYTEKDSRSWLFYANDFSEGVMSLDKFSLRFKDKEIATEFMAAIDAARAGTAVPIDCKATPGDTATAALTAELMLPADFYDEKPNCAGCRGCESDTFELPQVPAVTADVFANAEDLVEPPLPFTLPALTAPATPKTPLTNRSLLKQSLLVTPQATPESSETKASDATFTGFGGATSAANTFAAPSGGDADKTANTNTTFSFAAAFNSNAKTDEKKADGGFLFGSGAGNATSFAGGDKKPVFGQTPSMFGGDNKADSQNSTTNNLFGGTGQSIFGGKPAFGQSPSIFGGLNAKTEVGNGDGKSIFGSSAGSTTLTTGTGTSIFGSSGFGNTTAMQTSIFGSGASNLFGQKSSDTKTPASATGGLFGSAVAATDNSLVAGGVGGFADLSSKAGGIDFASLAAKANTGATKGTDKPGPGGFIGLTNQDAFSSFKQTLKLNDSARSTENGADGDGTAADDDNYDPHYEPIIPLPKEITVSTGEENETKLFGERATLFRYDAVNKEWKERAVGEVKILEHPEKGTYRLLMRREQVHKLVLNHFIDKDFKYKNLNNSPKSFCWATLNFAESNDGVLENLAVRFKKLELAEVFESKLKYCMDEVAKRAV